MDDCLKKIIFRQLHESITIISMKFNFPLASKEITILVIGVRSSGSTNRTGKQKVYDYILLGCVVYSCVMNQYSIY